MDIHSDDENYSKLFPTFSLNEDVLNANMTSGLTGFSRVLCVNQVENLVDDGQFPHKLHVALPELSLSEYRIVMGRTLGFATNGFDFV